MKTRFLLVIALALTQGGVMAQLPDFIKTDCNGITHHLYEDLAAGNAVVLNFCAGWCDNCRHADPILQAVYQQYCTAKPNVKFYGFLFETDTVGQPTDCTFGTKYARQYQLGFPIITNCSEIASQYFKLYDSSGSVPLFVIILPNATNPANSTVYSILGNDSTLQSSIVQKLASGGYMGTAVAPVITVSRVCGSPRLGSNGILGYTTSGPTTLRSNYATGNHWSTGDTTQSIVAKTSGYYGLTVIPGPCSIPAKTAVISISAAPVPVLVSSPVGQLCPGSPITLGFSGLMSEPPCTSSPNGQMPLGEFSIPSDTTTPLLFNNVYAGSYSVVKVEAGKFYYFQTFDATKSYENFIVYDNTITITDSTGSEVFATGLDYTIMKANYSGKVRFYTHEKACGTSQKLKLRAAACLNDLTANDLIGVGSLVWSPGGQTTPDITVSPAATTDYTLTFVDAFTGCSGSKTQHVIVGIGSVHLSTSNITLTGATLNWTGADTPYQWQYRYKTAQVGSKWTDPATIPGTRNSLTLSNLLPNQTYEWQIRGNCGGNWTDYSESASFSTGATSTLANISTRNGSATVPPATTENTLSIYPNPNNGWFTIDLRLADRNESGATILVKNMMGHTLYTEKSGLTDGLLHKYMQLPAAIPSGVYLVEVIAGRQSYQTKLSYFK